MCIVGTPASDTAVDRQPQFVSWHRSLKLRGACAAEWIRRNQSPVCPICGQAHSGSIQGCSYAVPRCAVVWARPIEILCCAHLGCWVATGGDAGALAAAAGCRSVPKRACLEREVPGVELGKLASCIGARCLAHVQQTYADSNAATAMFDSGAQLLGRSGLLDFPNGIKLWAVPLQQGRPSHVRAGSSSHSPGSCLWRSLLGNWDAGGWSQRGVPSPQSVAVRTNMASVESWLRQAPCRGWRGRFLLPPRHGRGRSKE